MLVCLYLMIGNRKSLSDKAIKHFSFQRLIMAYPTVDAPYGLKPVNLIGGQVFAGSTRQIKIASKSHTQFYIKCNIDFCNFAARLVSLQTLIFVLPCQREHDFHTIELTTQHAFSKRKLDKKQQNIKKSLKICSTLHKAIN